MEGKDEIEIGYPIFLHASHQWFAILFPDRRGGKEAVEIQLLQPFEFVSQVPGRTVGMPRVAAFTTLR